MQEEAAIRIYARIAHPADTLPCVPAALILLRMAFPLPQAPLAAKRTIERHMDAAFDKARKGRAVLRVVVMQCLDKGKLGDALGLMCKCGVPEIGRTRLIDDQSAIPPENLCQCRRLPAHRTHNEVVFLCLCQRLICAARIGIAKDAPCLFIIHFSAPFQTNVLFDRSIADTKIWCKTRISAI